MRYNPELFAEKYRLAAAAASDNKPLGGLCGIELEWNLLDSQFRPLLTVGSAPFQQSFVDYLRAECLSPWLREFSQLEVFHWMIEWATRPYYNPRGAIYEARMMEAVLMNALKKAGEQFSERIYIWPGNLPIPTRVGHDSIPGSWHLAKRLYLERCVDLYGENLATAGTHINLSLPDPLFTWDFMHLPASERIGSGRSTIYLDEYKSEFYISATRWMRAFASLFIAISAATPFQARVEIGRSAVILTENDSVRNLTFPNPPELDAPHLYRSYEDYLRISYELINRGLRFGNNNWTPVRARSFAEPVERLIAVTSDQLQDLYARGLYVVGQEAHIETMAKQIELQNLMARINLPMARVEVRTDDGGHSLELDIALLTLKYLLLIHLYADPEFARAFRYDSEDIHRARNNEERAAQAGLRAEIEHPLTGKPVQMRAFLRWTLDELRPLGEAFGIWSDLSPLEQFAAGAPNAAEQIRAHVKEMIGTDEIEPEAPLEVLQELAKEREVLAVTEIETIASANLGQRADEERFAEFLQRAREEAYHNPQAPIRFRPGRQAIIEVTFPDKTSEILDLAQKLIRIPSVTACPDERLDEVHRAAILIYDYGRDHGLEVRLYDQDKYPSLLIGLPGKLHAPVMLAGHFDVVEPEPDDVQFEPRVEGDYLWGRGSADMKTVVATFLVWLKDQLHKGGSESHINLLLVGNEENGESEAMGSPQLLQQLSEKENYIPKLFIAGERTGERGDETMGEICTENRGVIRFEVTARGKRGHSGIAPGRGAIPPLDLTERLLLARAGITGILGNHLTLSSPDGWQSGVKFPYIQIGVPGVYNISADRGLLGVEIRPIPQDDLAALRQELLDYCKSLDLEIAFSTYEAGVVCSPGNPYLAHLIHSVGAVSGTQPRIGRKLAGTSARFALAGQGVVWGQSGIGPHAKDERHFIPSILPYYQALDHLADRLRQENPPLLG